jgi:ATP-binding cassette subfamily C exporter for protease/lipase
LYLESAPGQPDIGWPDFVMFMFSGLFEMNRKPKAHDELATAILTFRKTFLTVGAFSFFINLLMLSPSLYMMQVYDRVLGSRNETTLLVLTGLMLGVYILIVCVESCPD